MKLTFIFLSLCYRLTISSHYYGEEMFADVTSNSTHETISIYWRIIWANGASNIPSNEPLTTCSSGAPCPTGPSTIGMSPSTSNCVAKGIATADGLTKYDSWTGVSSTLYYPIDSVPTSNRTIGFDFQDKAWGLLPGGGKNV